MCCKLKSVLQSRAPSMSVRIRCLDLIYKRGNGAHQMWRLLVTSNCFYLLFFSHDASIYFFFLCVCESVYFFLNAFVDTPTLTVHTVLFNSTYLHLIFFGFFLQLFFSFNFFKSNLQYKPRIFSIQGSQTVVTIKTWQTTRGKMG